MSALNGQPGEVRLTVEVKRKETGEVETHELIGRLIPEEDDEAPTDEEE
jgi:hypothetical protein